MYIVNPESIDKNKLYACGGLVANYLIYERSFSLFGRDKLNAKYFFVKTEALIKAIEELPLYYKIGNKLGN